MGPHSVHRFRLLGVNLLSALRQGDVLIPQRGGNAGEDLRD